MCTSRFWGVGLLAGCLLIGAAARSDAVAEDPPEQKDLARLRKFREHARRAAARYEIWLGQDRARKLMLREAPILQWTNPVGGRKAQGEVFLWTDRGRAEVVVSIYKMLDPTRSYFYEDREFCSLAPGPLVAISPKHEEWKPAEAGVSWHLLPDVRPPRDTRALRLRQMRLLAGRFTADKTTRDGIERNLRLLTQPVYRYEGDHPDLLDAALFAFVEGTDPEALLLLEARAGERGQTWHYALARMNSLRLRGYYRDELVWEAKRFDSIVEDAVYTVFRAR